MNGLSTLNTKLKWLKVLYTIILVVTGCYTKLEKYLTRTKYDKNASETNNHIIKNITNKFIISLKFK